MNKRCIINVATGDFYCGLQDRLLRSFAPCIDRATIYSKAMDPVYNIPIQLKYSNSKGIDLILWKDILPTGSKPHGESPYGFKAHAIKAAYQRDYTSVLWLDSPAYAVKEDVSPIFEKMEQEGYYVMSHIDNLENWVGDYALHNFGFRRETLYGYNLPSGSCYGFDLAKQGLYLFRELMETEAAGLFRSEHVIVDHKVIGSHRHDEALLALILLNHKLPVFTMDPLFQSDSPECVIKSGG